MQIGFAWTTLGYTCESTLMLMLQHFGHLMQRTDSLEKTLMLGEIEGKRRRGKQRMRWLNSITSSTDMNWSKLQERVENRGVWWAEVQEVQSRTEQH